MNTIDKYDMDELDLKLDILEHSPNSIMAVDKEFNIIYISEVGRKWLGKELEDIIGKKCYDLFKTPLCNKPECGIKQAMENDKSVVTFNDKPFNGDTISVEDVSYPLKNGKGDIIGVVAYTTDIRNRVKMESDLSGQSQTIFELATPVIKIWDGILLLPLVGVIDTLRAQQIIENLLNSIVEYESELAILDLTGVQVVDTAVARHIIKTVNAAKMLGSEVILTGFTPDVSQTLVELGIDLSNIITCGTLKSGISKAFRIRGKKVVSNEG